MQPNTSRLPRNAFGRAHWDNTQVYWTRGDGRALSFFQHRAAPPGEKPAEKTVWLELLKDAIDKLVEADVHEDAKLETVYELFRKTLKEDPELQWDCIVTDMYTKDPWEDLKSEGCEAQRYPREVEQIPLGMHRFP